MRRLVVRIKSGEEGHGYEFDADRWEWSCGVLQDYKHQQGVGRKMEMYENGQGRRVLTDFSVSSKKVCALLRIPTACCIHVAAPLMGQYRLFADVGMNLRVDALAFVHSYLSET